MKKKILLITLLLSNIIYSQDWGEQILNQPIRGGNYFFGFSVDIDGDYAIVGAHGENERTGSAHVYKKNADGVWIYHQKIEAFVGQHDDEYFGWAVAIQGDFIYISARTDRLNEVDFEEIAGSVMIYKKDVNDVWNGIQRIRSNDIRIGDNFGYDIAVDGDYLLVGANGQDYDADNENQIGSAGAAYLFKKDNNDVYTQIQKLVPSHRSYSDNIGTSLSISGDYIVLASKSDTDEMDENEIRGTGSAFVFKKGVGDVWAETQKLKPSNGVSYSNFGNGDVTISGDFIAIGADNIDVYDNETNNWYYGSVYLFKKNEDNIWNESQILKTPFPASNFGSGVSLDNNLLLVSAPESRVENNGSTVLNVGLSYLFKKNESNQFILTETIKASQVNANSTIGKGEWDGNSSTASIAISGNHFIIGAPNIDLLDEIPNIYNAGSAFISGDVTSLLGQTITWTGNINTDWNTPENWSTNTIPTEIDDVILANVANAPKINFNQSYIVNDLTTFKTLTIKNNASLTVNGNLDQGANIQVESFVNGNGSFILRGDQLNVNPADLIYLRYISGNAWHLFSSPATNVNIDDLALATQLAEGQGNNRGIGFYDNNANPHWSYYQNGANDTGNFIEVKGYSIQTSANAFLNFTGKLKATDINNYPITENLNGWNLIGNPYPAFINANINADANANFLSENLDNLDPLAANIYLWNPNTSSYDPVGNGLAAEYIAPGQAFFIKSKENGGTINIHKTMLNHLNGGLFLKQNLPEKIVLQLENNHANVSQTTIVFKDGMTNGLDISYDAAVFSGETSDFSLYTQLLESYQNTPFAIQFLPKINIENINIPLGIQCKNNSENTFSIKESNLNANNKIYLEDTFLNTFTEISTHKKYNFPYLNNTNGLGRFYLHIQNTALHLNPINHTSKVKIYKSNASTLQIKGISKGILNIFDINGKNVLKNTLIHQPQQTIQLPKIKKGIYLITIKEGNGTKIVKKITL